MTELTKDDLKIGAVYRGKRKRIVGYDAVGPIYDDRQILWLGLGNREVQYDSASIAFGRHFPKVPVEQFLKWTKEQIA